MLKDLSVGDRRFSCCRRSFCVSFVVTLIILATMADNPEEAEGNGAQAAPKEENQEAQPQDEAAEDMLVDPVKEKKDAGDVKDVKSPMAKTESTMMRSSDAQQMVVPDEKLKFPSTLDEFGFYFNEDGKLLSKDTNEPFVFKVKDDHNYNQKRYEALGEIITEHVYKLLEEEVKLKRRHIPTDRKDDEPTSFVFQSDDLETNREKLMVLIHGSGVVRAGQWARRLIINDCLDSGTQLPFIKKAQEEGYAILVLNTNLNVQMVDGNEEPIRGSESPEAHAFYVWKHLVKELPAKHIAIVAHSYGGRVTTYLVDQFYEDFKERVFAIAFTDSVHFIQDVEKLAAANFLRKCARNWVSSDLPLDEEIEPFPGDDDVPQVSAGHIKHEHTSWSSFNSIFKFFKQKLSDQNEKDEL